MKQSLRLGKVAGIPVGAHWTVAVIIALITWIVGAGVLPGLTPGRAASTYVIVAVAVAVLFTGSLLAHELAHALVARRKGVQVRSITLWMLGGVTELEGEAQTPGAELRIALAGPATSVAAAAVFGGGALAASRFGGQALLTQALGWLAEMNVILAVFNMLPGAPLDGGRVLKAALWRRYRDRARADQAAGRAGQYLGVAIAVAGAVEVLLWGSAGGLWLVLIGWFLASTANAEAKAAGVRHAMTGVRVEEIMTPDPDIAPAWTTPAVFADQVAGRSRHSVFPVLAFDGTLVGVVSLRLLGRLTAGQRRDLRLDRVAIPVPPRYLAAPQDPAEPLFTRPPLGGELAAVVLRDGRVAGMVTTDDLRRALHLAPLRRAEATGTRPDGSGPGRGELAGHPATPR